jgi:hypothetical protein
MHRRTARPPVGPDALSNVFGPLKPLFGPDGTNQSQRSAEVKLETRGKAHHANGATTDTNIFTPGFLLQVN